MANVLPRSKQLAVLNALIEGTSIRATARMTDVSIPTVLSLLVRVGEACADLLDGMLRGLTCSRIECDEIWAFVQKKQKQVRATDDATQVGDAWTFVAFDPDTKLVASHVVGKRDAATTDAFIADLRTRLSNRVQLTTDGLALYKGAIADSFGADGIDYAILVKEYETEVAGPGRYSPPSVKSIEKIPVFGAPEETLVSTSGVERQNLTMRMQMRRLTRLTNAHSKLLRNHKAATALHFAHYNFVRQHSTIRCTPAMAAGVASRAWSMDDLLSAALDGVRP
ncbi:MAG: IS1 family transposase [Polyangiales bacterium]